jgi:hypothetical protein
MNKTNLNFRVGASWWIGMLIALSCWILKVGGCHVTWRTMPFDFLSLIFLSLKYQSSKDKREALVAGKTWLDILLFETKKDLKCENMLTLYHESYY